jgi:hypothetical protein
VPDEELRAKLIVPDTGPLITLAAADSLDYRFGPGSRPDDLDYDMGFCRDLKKRTASTRPRTADRERPITE